MGLPKSMNYQLIEDAAQSFGATYKGKKSCNLSTIGSTSFFPSKPLGCYGDGGALFTNDNELAEKFRRIRVHGQERKHHHPILGINGRMDTLQAAILFEILEAFPEEVKKREEIGSRYTENFLEVEDLQTQVIPEESTSVYAQYTILSSRREKLRDSLKKLEIPSVSYYSVPLHLQPVFSDLGHKFGDFPVSEKIGDECLSLPMHPYLPEAQQMLVIDCIRS